MKVKNMQKLAKKNNKPVKALPPLAAGKLVDLFYRRVRGTPLFAGNLRREDFTAQNIEGGCLTTPLGFLITVGEQGTSVSTSRIMGNLFDLCNGNVFDTAGIKQRTIKARGKSTAAWAKSKGTAHTVRIKAGPMKGEHKGFIIGDMSKMNVAFISADGESAWTLDNKTLPNGRNAKHCYSLVK